MLNNRIRYVNFTPTDGFLLYADSAMTRLLDLAPSDSATASSIEKRGSRYSCRIEIVSAVQRFEATIARSVNPKSALDVARCRIAHQLSKWHQRRFAIRV